MEEVEPTERAVRRFEAFFWRYVRRKPDIGASVRYNLETSPRGGFVATFSRGPLSITLGVGPKDFKHDLKRPYMGGMVDSVMLSCAVVGGAIEMDACTCHGDPTPEQFEQLLVATFGGDEAFLAPLPPFDEGAAEKSQATCHEPHDFDECPTPG